MSPMFDRVTLAKCFSDVFTVRQSKAEPSLVTLNLDSQRNIGVDSYVERGWKMSVLRSNLYSRAKSFPHILPHASIPSRGASVASATRFKKLKDSQAAMQCDDGVPIYLKKGTRDMMLYRFTLFLMAVETIDGVRFIWQWFKK